MKIHNLVRGSVVVTLGTVLSGALAYIYSSMVGRMLGPVKFGDLGVIISLLTILTSVGTAILTVTMRYTSEFYTKNDLVGVARIHKRLARLTLYLSLILTVVCLLLSPFFGSLLAIHDRAALFIAVFTIVLSLMVIVNRGALQGIQRFPAMSFSLIGELILKLLLTYAVLRAGYGLVGVAASMLVTGMFSYWLTGYFLRDLLKAEENVTASSEGVTRKQLWQYAWPTVITTFLLLLAMSIDVMAVKKFFSPETAGQYIAVSTIAKIIFYVTGSISTVMFPLITEQQTRGEKHYGTLIFSVLFTLLGSLILLGTYYIFQEKIVTALYGEEYRALGHLLPEVGWLVVWLALVNLLVNYFMSIKTFKFTIYFALITVAEVIALYLHHDSIEEVVRVLQIGTGLLFALMLVNYLLMKRSQITNLLRPQA